MSKFASPISQAGSSRRFGRWALVAGLLANVLVIGMVALAALQSRERAVDSALFLTENYSRVLEESLLGVVRTADSVLVAVSDEVSRGGTPSRGDQSRLEAFMARKMARVPEAYALLVADEKGLIRQAAGELAVRGIDISDRDYFARLRDSPDAGLVISGPLMGKVSKQWLMMFSRRLSKADGSFGGSVHLAVSNRQIVDLLAKLDLGRHGNSGLWTPTTLVARYAHDDPEGARTGATTPSVRLRELLTAGTREAHYFAASGIDGIERSYYFRRVGDLDLYTVVGLAETDYLADWRADTQRLIMIAGIFVLVTLLSGRAAIVTWKRREQTRLELQESERRLDLCIDGAELAMTDWEVKTDRILFGSGWTRLLGYELPELNPRPSTLLQLIHAQDVAHARDALLHHLKGETAMLEAEVRMRHKDGRWIWVLARGKAVERDAEGRVTRITGIGMDITLRKEAEAEIARLSQWNELLLNSAGEGIFGVDLEGHCTFINPAAISSLGYTREEIVGHNQHELFHQHRADGRPSPEADCPVFATLRDGIRREVDDHFIRKSGEVFPVQMTVTPIHEETRLVGAEVVFQDISRRKAMEAELIRLANTDALTGIANRRRLLEFMEGELARVKRFGESSFLLMLDLDKFKEVNDTWGHSIGDQALRHFADLCRLRVRQSDFFGRLGGEEFGIVLSRTDRAGATQFAESLRRYVADSPLQTAKGAVQLTVSIGIAEFRAADETMDSLLVRADMAMYRAKAAGRNNVVIDAA